MSPEDAPTIFVIDDDDGVRASILGLLKAEGLQSEGFAGPQEFLNSTRPERPGCLILDVRFPGISGLDLQDKLAKMGVQIPIIFITAHGDIPNRHSHGMG